MAARSGAPGAAPVMSPQRLAGPWVPSRVWRGGPSAAPCPVPAVPQRRLPLAGSRAPTPRGSRRLPAAGPERGRVLTPSGTARPGPAGGERGGGGGAGGRPAAGGTGRAAGVSGKSAVTRRSHRSEAIARRPAPRPPGGSQSPRTSPWQPHSSQVICINEGTPGAGEDKRGPGPPGRSAGLGAPPPRGPGAPPPGPRPVPAPGPASVWGLRAAPGIYFALKFIINAVKGFVSDRGNNKFTAKDSSLIPYTLQYCAE